ncbi:hypothetical protein [Pseudonocardia humida]|uniref:Uncharacterized protein n=1 Tax=Pseudonocardia humida TaxID=2800819 RepID=A0ABT0ZVR2_9PSEU|nr:hypothetical protein [Pseudonocardia humida]MCO1654827.1 hypothetical protein [Pseudonocardia humida]
MGVLGEMFPGPRIRDESAEAGDGEQPWRLGPIDLDNNVVEVHRGGDAEPVPPTPGADVRSAVPGDGAPGEIAQRG